MTLGEKTKILILGMALGGLNWQGQCGGQYFDQPDQSFGTLLEACNLHTDGRQVTDITIATCWDADRLDLPRVGIRPNPDRMGTAPGRRLARSQQK